MEAGDIHSRAGEFSTEDLISVKILDEFVSPERSLKEQAPEEEKEEDEVESKSATTQESCTKQQLLLDEFSKVHDEAQRLRIMNLLLQFGVVRFMKRRIKTKGGLSSTTFAAARTSQPVGDAAAVAESLEKELREAGKVRCQLEAELHHSAMEEELRQRLSTARQQLAEKSGQLEQLQAKLTSRLRAPPARRQEAERMLKRVWPQLLRVRKERLLHTRAKRDLESARQQVAELEVFGQQRSMAAYEELLADSAKLAERAHERTEQVDALRSAADTELQRAAHLQEALRGAHLSIADARSRDERANMVLRKARQEVVKTKKQRSDLFKEKNKLKRQMELLAYPELLRDHEEVRRRLRVAQSELEKLRAEYIHQERRIALAQKLVQQREQSLRECLENPAPDEPFLVLHMDAKGRPTLLDTKRGR